MFSRTQWRRVVQSLNRCHSIAFSKRYLLYTNLGISISLSMVGDTIEQSYERYVGEIDGWNRMRTFRMGIGGFTVGFVCHFWYQYLDYRYPTRSIGTVMRKILLDQVICSPFYITVFFITMGLLERQSWEEFQAEVMEKAVVLYMAEWTVWPAAQFINFFLIKPRYRVFYDNSMSLGYDIYTSKVKYRKKPSLESPEA
ncbi:GL25076 [Drosophila persimilis]|uniref:GL25076 n=1 Tax=Drosophila persimilis TaxID=7234 RepID=B4GQV9_DROPE|nr:mpv17-like protein 2 [Drosophila persimilis]EDW40144.1 GL25076 [Drosophila persimilis]